MDDEIYNKLDQIHDVLLAQAERAHNRHQEIKEVLAEIADLLHTIASNTS